MGVFIGLLVLLLSFALVVLMAVSEWYDFDPGASVSQAVSQVLPAKPAPRRKTSKKKRRS